MSVEVILTREVLAAIARYRLAHASKRGAVEALDRIGEIQIATQALLRTALDEVESARVDLHRAILDEEEEKGQ